MCEIYYKLLKYYESPAERICVGVVKTEEEWMKHFPHLYKGYCKIKTDWFEEVEEKEKEPEYRLGISFFKNGIETYYKEYDFKELING